MGIPRLTTFIQPYGVAIGLGDSSSADQKNPERVSHKVIIDGPGLAYHIYYRLLACKTESRNPFEAAPSYEELGKGVLDFLDELQKHNIIM